MTISFSKFTFAGDINLTNLPCLTSVLPGDTSDSQYSSYNLHMIGHHCAKYEHSQKMKEEFSLQAIDRL